MEDLYINNHFSSYPSFWMPGQEKMVSPPTSSAATTTVLSNSSVAEEAAVHTPATSADSKVEHGIGCLKMEIGASATASGLPDHNSGGRTSTSTAVQADDNDDYAGTPVPTYSWILPASQSISPPNRAASPSTASSASSSSSDDDGAASSLALFVKTQVTRLREIPRPILANRLSNLGPIRAESRISRWMLDVEAQQQVGNRGARWDAREGEQSTRADGRVMGERAYGTMGRSADRGVVAKRSWGMREGEIYVRDVQASEDECEMGDGCACGCWWQWVLLTLVVLALIAWGLWATLGDQDLLGR